MTDALFPPEQLEIPLAAQIAEVERELKLRDHVYPRRVDAGKMTAAAAAEHTAAMQAVLATLHGVTALRDRIKRLESDVAAYKGDLKEMQRDMRDAAAEAEQRARAGEPYGTF